MFDTATIGLILVPLMFFFLFIGVPVAFGIGLAAVTAILLWGQLPLVMIFQQFYQGADSFTLLAIPLFMLAGELMMRIGIVDDLLAFCDILIGRLRGGLGYVNVLANVFFASLSGSAVADMAAIGTIMTPKMVEQGYKKEFALALTAAGSAMGPIIPPSILLVVYSSAMMVSTGTIFIAAIVPGLMFGLGLMIYLFFKARKENLPRSSEVYTAKRIGKITARAIPALFTPVIILGGIFSGIFSATESAGIATVYALLLGVLYYRSLTWEIIKDSFLKGMVSGATILLLIAVAKPFAYLMAMSQLPATIGAFVTTFIHSKFVLLLVLNIIFLILGCVMEATVNVLIFAPIFAPLAISAGVDPVHFGIIMCCNLLIGVATPPFGVSLFVGCNIGNCRVEDLIRPVLPLCLVEIAALLLFTYIPDLVLLLPRIMGIYG